MKHTAHSPLPPAAESATARTMRERLGSLLGRQGEALSPRVLRRTLAELQAVGNPLISDVEGARLAAGVAQWYARATAQQRHDCWLLMSEQFAPDVSMLEEARRDYEAALGTPAEAQAEVRLRRAFISPRTRLLQRFAAFPDGMRFLVDMRAELLPALKSDKRLLALDAEEVIGYVGVWLLGEEGHITNVAVAPEMRRRGVGASLLAELMRIALGRSVHSMTLEVRPSNEAALALYKKFGFRSVGRRPHYYTDNAEDAEILWNTDIEATLAALGEAQGKGDEAHG